MVLRLFEHKTVEPETIQKTGSKPKILKSRHQLNTTIMGSFAEAIKSDSNLQQQVADAVKEVAKAHGLSMEGGTSYSAKALSSSDCINVCGTLCACSA